MQDILPVVGLHGQCATLGDTQVLYVRSGVYANSFGNLFQIYVRLIFTHVACMSLVIGKPKRMNKRHALNQVPEALDHPQRLVLVVHGWIGSGGVGIALGVARLQLLVQIHQDHTEEPEADDGHAEHGRHNSVTLAVSVFRQVPDVHAGDVAKLREGVDQGQRDGSLSRRTREGGTDPGVHNDEAGVGTRLQEEGDVSGGGVEGGHADDEADETHDDRAVNVPDLYAAN